MTAGLKHDLKHVERFHYGRPLPELALVPPFEKIGDWYPYRLVVKGGRMTTFVDGRKIHEAPLPAERDPWLAVFVQAQLTGRRGRSRSRARRRSPIDSTSPPCPTSPAGWPTITATRSPARTPTGTSAATRSSAASAADLAGSRQESVLRYNRPMLEDGEITYEFYYEPGKAMVHPALDRLTFLLEPDGVKIHWMTDAQYDRSGLKPDNAAVEPDNRRGPPSLPLKPKDWNRLNLSTSGDRVALRLNGVEIYSRAIEPTNQRIFGLFHELDQTEVRVRSVTYAGQWPRQLPRSVAGP